MIALLTFAFVGLITVAAFALDVHGVHFDDRVSMDGAPLVLNGAGARRATIFKVKVYVAGLYVAQRTQNANDILRPDRPKYFVAVMKRDVSRDDSAPVFRANVERSAGADAPSIASEIVAFERWIPTMREGQQLMVEFQPNTGVVVRSTAKTEAFRGSARFGNALFGIWIGPTAADADLRSALLHQQ